MEVVLPDSGEGLMGKVKGQELANRCAAELSDAEAGVRHSELIV